MSNLGDDSLKGLRLASTTAFPCDPGDFVQRYSEPLVAFVVFRYKMNDRNDARDLVQRFMTEKVLVVNDESWLRTGRIKLVQKFELRKKQRPEIGFRQYLVTSLNNFMMDHFRRKRLNPEQIPVDIKVPSSLEEQRSFDIDWANNLIQQAIKLVREECQRIDQNDVWNVLDCRVIQPYLNGKDPPSYQELADRFGFQGPKQASNRLVTATRKFNRVIRELVASYVSPRINESKNAEIESEIRSLRCILSQPGVLRWNDHDGTTAKLKRENLFSVPEEGLWDDKDLPMLWQHLTSQSLHDVLTDFCPSLAIEFANANRFANIDAGNLTDLWHDRRPNLEVLQAIKKAMRKEFRSGSSLSPSSEIQSDAPIRSALPKDIAFVVYISCIACAWVRSRKRITAARDDELRSRIRIAVGKSWIDDRTRQLLETSLDEFMG